MNAIKKNKLKEIKAYAEKILSNDKTGHDMDHIHRVVCQAQRIQKIEGGNLFIILAGAYLHDVMDDKLVSDPQEARNELGDFLDSIQLDKDEQQHLFEVIDNVSFSHQLENKTANDLTLEAKIVQDADRLDALGAIGIGRTFYYGGRKGHKMYDETILPRENMTKEDYRVNQTVINHFYEKLFKLKEMMQTKTGVEMAKKKTDFMVLFVENFIEESK
ncbi:MAG: HD domain-containing protein [Vagococcus sp.]|uniref:HD domain-containing protein n=1 Tax=Vagococcus sp. TaxID=1933889 RepID=UPI002FC7AEB7